MESLRRDPKARIKRGNHRHIIKVKIGHVAMYRAGGGKQVDGSIPTKGKRALVLVNKKEGRGENISGAIERGGRGNDVRSIKANRRTESVWVEVPLVPTSGS